MQKNNNGMWLPLIASVGVGAATYYTMTKHDQGIGQTMEKMIPFVSQMGGGGSASTGAGMNMSSGTNMSGGTSMGNTSSINNKSGSSTASSQNSGKLGPYGMS